MKSVSPISDRRVVIVGIPVLFLLVYLASASRTIVLDDTDAAEFQVVGVMGGTLHQPYPLWSMLARVFAAVPVGDPAFRVTLLSIVLACAALAALVFVMLRISGSSLAAGATAAAFGLSYTFWRFASIAEVYALQTLLFLILLVVLVRRDPIATSRDVFAVAFVTGLLISQHSASLALAPAIILLVAWDLRRAPQRRRAWLASVSALLLPATLYLYTFFVDRGPYPLNWLDNFGQDVIRAQGYVLGVDAGFLTRLKYYLGVGRLETDWPGAVEMLRSLIRMAKNVAGTQYPLVGAALLPVGLVSLWKRNRRAAIFLLAVALPHVAMYCAIATTTVGDALAYSIPAFAVGAILIAEGIRVLHARGGRAWAVLVAVLLVTAPFVRYAESSPLSRSIRPRAPAVATDAWRGEFVNLREHNDLGERYGAAVADIVEPGSVVFARWAETHVLLYHQLVLGRFQGVAIRYAPPDPQRAIELIDTLHPTSVYFTYPPRGEGLTGLEVEVQWELTPHRRLYRVSPALTPQRT